MRLSLASRRRGPLRCHLPCRRNQQGPHSSGLFSPPEYLTPRDQHLCSEGPQPLAYLWTSSDLVSTLSFGTRATDCLLRRRPVECARGFARRGSPHPDVAKV